MEFSHPLVVVRFARFINKCFNFFFFEDVPFIVALEAWQISFHFLVASRHKAVSKTGEDEVHIDGV